jgi:hypothetical protein
VLVTRRQHQSPSVPLSFGGNDVTASSVVRKHGVFVDLDLSLRHHDVVITARFRQLRKHPLSRLCSDDIVMTSLILARLDYCNSVLFGRPDVIVSRLQSFQNAAACVVFALRWTAHVTDILI